MTVTITDSDAKALRSLLPRIIKSPTMLGERTVCPTYDEVIAMVELYNQLHAQAVLSLSHGI